MAAESNQPDARIRSGTPLFCALSEENNRETGCAADMRGFSYAILLCIASAALCSSTPTSDHHDDLQPESSQRRIHDIIQSHEGRKYGDHGGHEYGEDEHEAPHHDARRLKLATKPQRFGYVATDEIYGDIQRKRRPKDDVVYREHVYAPEKTPSDHHALNDAPREYYVPKEEPREYYAIKKLPRKEYYAKKVPVYVEEHKGHAEESPLSNEHYVVPDPKSHDSYVVIDPNGHGAYAHEVVDPKHHYVAPLPKTHYADPKPHYVEHEPHYVAVEPKTHYVAVKPKPHYVAVEPKPHYVAAEPKPHYVAAEPNHVAHADHEYQLSDKAHLKKGHGYYGDQESHQESGHKDHGHHDVSAHQEHSSQAGHHAKHHNKGSYERDRGYHYEKAYAYDRIRAHHDVGGSQGAHAAYQSAHAKQGHQDKGHHGGGSYMYFKKKDNHHGGEHYLGNKESHKRGHAGQGYYDHHPYGYAKL